MTLLAPEVLDDLGYSPRDNFLVHAFDLTDRGDIDGLIGLDYLRQFNYEIRSTDGRIHVERV
jgi:hypothetical protein